MSDESRCSQCNALRSADLPAGLCVRCLLTFGLKEIDDTFGEGELSSAEDLLSEPFVQYRTLEKLGEGGCGVVYRAEQLKPVHREVALKIIKPGMDTRNVIARFEAERQALALMDHPGIAKIFDAGTTSAGRPYFAMELVRGERITDWCENHGLNITQRLHLFAEVCRAIQHAHQKGVIHRDIKPSNVLVVESDGRPQPKVIDFGVAKATARQRLGKETIYTAFDQFVGTPAYMSPEQAGLEGDDVDTRSDIYSLGVLLYELLTGRPPFDPERLRRATLNETCRIICEEEPLKPSTRLAQTKSENKSKIGYRKSAIPADLDWIVMKALEKDRARRYQTANDLALDVERFLNDEPVAARSPSASYRLRKLIRRHRSATLTMALVTVTLITGTIVSTMMAIRARRAEQEQSRLREHAQQEAAAAKHVITLLNNTYNHWRPIGGRRRHTLAWTTVIETLRERAHTRLQSKEALAGRLMFLLIQADHFSWSGDLPDAEALLREALSMADQLPSGNEDVHAGIRECLALVLRRMSQPENASQFFSEALELRQRFQSYDPMSIQVSYAYAYATDHARESGQLPLAESMGRLHIEALKQKYGATNLAVMEALLSLGRTLAAESKINETRAIYREALATMRATPIASDDPEIEEIRDGCTRVLEAVADYLAKIGDHEESAQLKTEAAACRANIK